VITAWTKHIKEDAEKQRYQDSLRAAKWILDREIELLEEAEDSLDRQEISPKVYNEPNWDYRQAHANGYRQCLRDIKNLINLDPKEIKYGGQPISQ